MADEAATYLHRLPDKQKSISKTKKQPWKPRFYQQNDETQLNLVVFLSISIDKFGEDKGSLKPLFVIIYHSLLQ